MAFSLHESHWLLMRENVNKKRKKRKKKKKKKKNQNFWTNFMMNPITAFDCEIDKATKW